MSSLTGSFLSDETGRRYTMTGGEGVEGGTQVAGWPLHLPASLHGCPTAHQCQGILTEDEDSPCFFASMAELSWKGSWTQATADH